MGNFRLLESSSRSDTIEAFAADVRAGLDRQDKSLPCRWLYDKQGSLLFEQICALDEYYIPRAEGEIIEARADQIASALTGRRSIVELGSGSAQKTRLILEAFLDHGTVTYVPIDVSLEILSSSSRALAAGYAGLDVTAIHGTYEEGLARLAEAAPAPRLVLWLGSNVGNLTRSQAAEFLAGMRQRLGHEDVILMGVDLRKDADVLNLAYDDPEGVTRRFSKNILARINRELGGTFDLARFTHRARYLEDEGRVEIKLVSEGAQRVTIERLELEVAFLDGEAIHTEDSTKYSLAEIDELAEAAGLSVSGRFFDGARRFCDVLMRP